MATWRAKPASPTRSAASPRGRGTPPHRGGAPRGPRGGCATARRRLPLRRDRQLPRAPRVAPPRAVVAAAPSPPPARRHPTAADAPARPGRFPSVGLQTDAYGAPALPPPRPVGWLREARGVPAGARRRLVGAAHEPLALCPSPPHPPPIRPPSSSPLPQPSPLLPRRPPHPTAPHRSPHPRSPHPPPSPPPLRLAPRRLASLPPQRTPAARGQRRPACLEWQPSAPPSRPPAGRSAAGPPAGGGSARAGRVDHPRHGCGVWWSRPSVFERGLSG